ncbi:MAG: T9SS type A sorting domain-containing protein, partial [Candidatus Cloacimonetes bacterium]|nr:T9SS type A sorting domain-containing protein [Candidatus Cloacimonadota bacterium]
TTAGVIVGLTNNTNPSFSYRGTADGTNMVSFSRVPGGTYTLAITARPLGFANHLDENVTITGDSQIIFVELVASGVVLEEGFENTTGYTLPLGWTKEGLLGAYGWRTITPSHYDYTYPEGVELNAIATPHEGERMGFRGWPYTTPANWLFTSGFYLHATPDYPATVSFYYMAPGWINYGESDDFEVRIGQTATSTGMADAPVVFSQTGIMHPGPTTYNTWSYAEYAFQPLTTGTYYLAFHDMTIADQGFFIVIDDVEVAQQPMPDVDENNPEINLPKATALKGNFPNPFNPTTSIVFDLAKDGNVKIEIFNLKGQKVTTITDKNHKAGSYTVVWDGTDDYRSSVSSGVYFYRFTTDEMTVARKMILLK